MFNLGDFSMKKTLVAIAALAATAAFAQSTVTISGKVDVGFVYDSSRVTDKIRINNGDNSRIVFSGVEDLGGGMAATFAAQMRFAADTGYQDSVTNGAITGTAGADRFTERPLFQGESRVGLRGGFGHIRLGRGLTAVQAPNGAYDPFGVRTVGSMQGNLTAGYSSDPLQPNGSGAGRWSNAVFYDTPNMGGFVGSVSLQMKEQEVGRVTNGTSLAATYNNGPLSLFGGYEKNTVDTKYLQIAGAYNLGVANLMASWATNDPVGAGNKVTGIGFGLVAPLGAITAKAGYSQAKSEVAGAKATTKFAVGMDYALSKRTMLYTNIARSKAAAVAPAVGASKTEFDFGLQHNF
jgi:predicted porin